MGLNRIDYAIAALIGFLVGVFAIPTLINLAVRERAVLALLPLILPPLWVGGVWLGGALGRYFPFMTQFGKFAAVGLLNTAIDFGTLNLLSVVTGITAGFVIGGVNIPGFSVAAFNSYLWNKFWVFRGRGAVGIFSDFPKFLAVAVAGVLINGTVVVTITLLPPFAGVNPTAWLNFSKAVATAITFAWNFIGYKFLVFRS